MLPVWMQAGLWGFVAGGALLVGAVVGYVCQLPKRVIAGIMAFGSGVLISAMAFELMDDACEVGGLGAAAVGFVAGAVIFTGANWAVNQYGAKHRKRSTRPAPAGEPDGGGGLAIAIGALIDGIPESIAIGLSLLAGGAVRTVTVAAVFISNIPEGLSSAAGMKNAGRSATHIFGTWLGIAIACGLASLAGYSVFRYAPPQIVAATTAVAAGGILAMLADTMIPEAFEGTHDFAGLITCAGFLASFVLSGSGS